jgi:hypothetical protein
MRKAFTILAAVVFLAAAFLATVAARQSSTDRKPEAAAIEAQKPGPETDRLKFLIGTWSTDGGYEKSPMFPEGGKQTGWYEARVGPGGFSIIADFELHGLLGKEIGHQVIAWNPKQNAYQVVTVGNNFPGAILGTSRWEGGNLVTRSELILGGTVFQSRSVYSNLQEKSVHMEEFMQAGQAPEQLIWKAAARRK